MCYYDCINTANTVGRYGAFRRLTQSSKGSDITLISINYRDPRPIYEQVKDGFCRLMVAGVLDAGDKLPSVRELAAELAINPNTIQRAYRELEAEGYIYSIPGKGSFASDAASARSQKLGGLLTEFDRLSREIASLGVSCDELKARLEQACNNSGGEET